MKHIVQVLEGYHEFVYTDREWILNVAMSLKELQVEGTFQAALLRKIDDVVTPIFAEIIAFVDCNYNLDLMDSNDPHSDTSHLWLTMFDNTDVCNITYEQLFPEKLGKPRQQVPGIGGRLSHFDFHCKFPFSWIIKEHIDVLLTQASHVAGKK